ncbi:hypothetical protein ILUMI_20785 [Ignelater luminosus]|uniref:Gamma-glutamylcyclotransferase family protein n=1 Tax=Ignelater luminosus TaxID=2038154 RepID=A0A8K0G206_IGNLU|nr:hypothetical protein ILUMI_20785 [Ignelater luminosus]
MSKFLKGKMGFNKTLLMAAKLHKVFVYGTLKKQEPNHHWFSKDNIGYHKFICDAETIQKYPLIIGTRYNIPFLLYSPGVGSHVKGEVYEVDDRVLSNLDILEDHPNYYIREQHTIKCLDGRGDSIEAWIYFIKNFKPDLLKQQMFENYSSNGSHGLQYVARYDRDQNYNVKSDILL